MSMSEMSVQEMQPSAPAEEAQSFLSRVINVFVAPSKAFVGLGHKWEWLIAALVIAALGFGARAIQMPYLGPDLKKAAMENIERFKDQLPADQYNEIVQQIETELESGLTLSPKNISIGIVAVIFVTFVIGLCGWLAGNFFHGGKLPLWQPITVAAFAGFIGILGDYATGGMMVLKGSSYVYIGLGMLKPTNDSSFLYYLLRQMEFVTMWKLAVLCIGFGVIYQKPSMKFFYVLLPLWLIFISLVASANLFTGGTIVY